VVIDGGYIQFVGFAVVHKETIGLSHKAEVEDRAWLSGQNWPDRFGESV
jgi:hypothetical protein